MRTSPPPLALAVDALAAARLTRLITRDYLTEGLRARAGARHAALGDLARCPHCVGVWAALAVTAARRLAPGVWPAVAWPLAVAGAVSELAERGW